MKASDITIYTSTNSERCTIGINVGAKGKFTLGSEDYITLPFSSEEPIPFEIGDWCDLTEIYEDTDGMNGKFAKVYKIISIPNPTYNTSTGGYDYQLRMDAYYYEWQNKLFMYMPKTGAREVSWSLTAPIETHLNCLEENLKAMGFVYGKGVTYEYSVDHEHVSTEAKTLSYNETSIIEGIQAIADAWECEWWVEDNFIRFGRKETNADAVKVENAVECETMTRSESKGTYATRIYVFGSERNIPATYRKSLKFFATSVSTASDGRVVITDVVRPLKKGYFPESAYVYDEGTIHNSSLGASGTETQSKTFTKTMQTKSVALTKGSYKYDLSNLGLFVKASDGVSTVDYAVKVVYGSNVISVTEGSETVNYDRDKTKQIKLNFDGEFTLEEDGNFYVELTLRYNFNEKEGYSSAEMYYAFAGNATATDLNRMPSIKTTLNIGDKEVEGVINATFSKSDENNIYLPKGTEVKVGDEFTITNIIGGNLPSTYWSADADSDVYQQGVVQRRLMLPDGIPYLDAYRYYDGRRVYIGEEHYKDGVSMPDSEAIEAVATTDTIYPRTNLTIKEVKFYEQEITENGTGTGQYERFYYVSIEEDFHFDEKYIIESKDLEIAFNSGSLNGRTFKVKNFLKAGTIYQGETLTDDFYEIEASEEDGRKLPDTILRPEEGNKFSLVGWDSTNVYETKLIESAESELEEYGEKKLKKMMVDDGVYNCPMMSYLVEKDTDKYMFSLGQPISLVNPSFFVGTRKSRVLGYEINLDIPYDTPQFTIGESTEYSRINDIEAKISEITFRGSTYTSKSSSGSGGSGVYVIARNDRTAPTDDNVYSAARSDQQYLRKDRDDATPHKLTVAELESKGKIKGGSVETSSVTIPTANGDFTDDWLGAGGRIWRDEQGKIHGVFDTIMARDSMVARSLEFNRIDVIDGETWNTFAFGTIEEVSKLSSTSGKAKLKLVDGELPSIKQNDICRGIFHNLGEDSKNNALTNEADTCGFYNMQGFATSYFAIESVGDDGWFEYSLKDEGTPHPVSGMKFAAYGNFKDETRMASTFSSRTRLIMLDKVNTWTIDPSKNYFYVRGDLNGLVFGDKTLQGHGTLQKNSYIYGSQIIFTADQQREMRGLDGYTISLSSYGANVSLNPDGTLPEGYFEALKALKEDDDDIVTETEGTETRVVVTKAMRLQTSVRVMRGDEELTVHNEGEKTKGHFWIVESELLCVGCEASVDGDTVTITSISEPQYCYVDIPINVEGNSVALQRYSIMGIARGARGAVKSTAFLRQDDEPTQPTGGTFSNPIPNGWSDGIPAITESNDSAVVWMTTRWFYESTEDTSLTKWSKPQRITDSVDYDICFHDGEETPTALPLHYGTQTKEDDNGWYNDGNENSVWRAEAKCKNGKWGDWVITRIRGEKGEKGEKGKDSTEPGPAGKDGIVWHIEPSEFHFQTDEDGNVTNLDSQVVKIYYYNNGVLGYLNGSVNGHNCSAKSSWSGYESNVMNISISSIDTQDITFGSGDTSRTYTVSATDAYVTASVYTDKDGGDEADFEFQIPVKVDVTASLYKAVDDDKQFLREIGEIVQGDEGLVGKVATIKADMDGVRASAEKVDGFDSRISEVEVTAEGISTKVSKVVGDDGKPTESFIEQTAESIDLSALNITAKTDNFRVANSSGETTISIDRDGNMVTTGDAKFSGKIVATSGSFSGTITAQDGEVGGFTLSSSYMEAKDDDNTMNLSAESIYYHNKNRDVNSYFGTSTMPASYGGSIACPLRVDVSRVDNYYGINIGAYLDVKGASLNDSREYAGNHALFIPNGDICGFRLHTRRISGSTTLTKYDSIVIYVGTSEATITMPSDPEDGQIIILKLVGYKGSVTMAGGTFMIGKEQIKSTGSYKITGGNVHILFYNGYNDAWCGGWTNSD